MAKMTKKQVVELLKMVGDNVQIPAEAKADIDFIVNDFKENSRNVSATELQETIKNIEKATNKTISELQSEATKAGATIVEVKPEEAKKETKKLAKKDTAETSKKVIKPKEEKAEKVEKTETPKETTTKSAKPTVVPMDMVTVFPEELTVESLDGATLKLRTDLKTIKDITVAYNNDIDFVIATYWNKRQLKQYADSYDPMRINPNRPKEFENDLDLIEVTFAHDLVVTGCSIYSIVPQIFLPENFEQDENNIRYANGVEFQVYQVISK